MQRTLPTPDGLGEGVLSRIKMIIKKQKPTFSNYFVLQEWQEQQMTVVTF